MASRDTVSSAPTCWCGSCCAWTRSGCCPHTWPTPCHLSPASCLSWCWSSPRQTQGPGGCHNDRSWPPSSGCPEIHVKVKNLIISIIIIIILVWKRTDVRMKKEQSLVIWQSKKQVKMWCETNLKVCLPWKKQQFPAPHGHHSCYKRLSGFHWTEQCPDELCWGQRWTKPL